MNRVTKVVDDLNEELVDEAEKIVRAMGSQAERLRDAGRSQLSRAIEVTRSAGSVRVFKNWLAYQAARDQSSPFWTQPAGDRKLVDRVQEALKLIEERINQSLPADPEVRREAITEALTRFLGFLRRAVVGWKYVLEQEAGR